MRSHAMHCAIATVLACSMISTVLAAPDGWEWPDIGVKCTPGGSGGCAYIREMITYDSGTGPALYVGGLFEYAGGKPANFIARWDGNSWSTLGEGVAGHLETMIAFEDLNGPAIMASGDFGLSRWDGRAWHPAGDGVTFYVYTLAVFNEGFGPSLYAGGGAISRWDGQKWIAIPGAPKNLMIRSMAVLDDGVQRRLYVGGNIGGNGMMYIGFWDGVSWTEIGPPTGVHPLSLFWRMTSFDDGTGQKLFVSGQFLDEVGVIPGMATWDGTKWTMANAGLPAKFMASDFTTVNEGETPVLYVMGAPGDAHRWDGAEWEPLGELQGSVYAGVGFDDGGGERLHVGGKFQLDAKMPNIARRKPSGGGTPTCGDLTGDGFVNQEDLGILLGDWGCTKGVGLCPGDCDGDGDTDQADLGILLSNWEQPCP